MTKTILESFIKRLVEIEPDHSPLVSAFINLDDNPTDPFAAIEPQARITAKRLSGQRRSDFEDAVEEIRAYLRSSVEPGTRSIALYSRWGDQPVFYPLQFKVPIETNFVVDSLPHIYPLVELKDTYHRFVIVITTEKEARILETTLGSVSSEVLAARPELRERIGREWTKAHYHNHKHERENKFIREKVRIVEELMSRRGHNHLIIAGSPKMVAKLTRALPDHLDDKLVSTMPTNPGAGIDPILLGAVRLFVAAENIESHDHVRRLENAVLGNGLGVAGAEAAHHAIENGYADMLIIDQDIDDLEVREQLVRAATLAKVPIETVNRSPVLRRLGGVGCLLRYKPSPTPEETSQIETGPTATAA